MKSFRYVVVVLALLMSVSLVKAEEVKKEEPKQLDKVMTLTGKLT
ncbi:MAG: hypothetical protein ACP5KH_02455 [Thermodesulfovibrio sp.]